MKRPILKILTLIFVLQPALLLAKQGEKLPALTVAQVKAGKAQPPKNIQQTKSVVQQPHFTKQHNQPVQTHQAPTVLQNQGTPPVVQQQVLSEQRIQQETVHDKRWQSIKNTAALPFSIALGCAQFSAGVWGLGATFNKIGFKNWPWPVGTSLPTFSTDSFKNNVVYSLPHAVVASLVVSVVDAGAYKAMKALGLKRYTISALIAESLHERGYDGFVKDKKDLKRLQRINSKIEQQLFKAVKRMLEEQKNQQFGAINNLNEQQIIELIDKELPEEQVKALFASALSQLNLAERKLLLNNPDIQKKVNYLMIDALKKELQRPVEDMFVHALIAQMPAEEKQKMGLDIIKGLSEKEQTRLKKLMIPAKLMEKEESVKLIVGMQSNAGLVKQLALGTLIGGSAAGWILKNIFGWVPGTVAQLSSRISQRVSAIANTNWKPTGSIFEPVAKKLYR